MLLIAYNLTFTKCNDMLNKTPRVQKRHDQSKAVIV